MKKILCIFLNLVLPGVGTLVLKRNLNGSLQLAMALFGLLLISTVRLAFFGLVLYGFACLWAVIETILIKNVDSSNPTPR